MEIIAETQDEGWYLLECQGGLLTNGTFSALQSKLLKKGFWSIYTVKGASAIPKSVKNMSGMLLSISTQNFTGSASEEGVLEYKRIIKRIFIQV